MNLKSQLELLLNILNCQFKFYKQGKYILGQSIKIPYFIAMAKKGYSRICGYHKIVTVLNVMDSDYSNSRKLVPYSKSFIAQIMKTILSWT